MDFVQVDATIPVDMAVSRYRQFPEDGMVQIWGYVGDYEICVHLPVGDDRVRRLIGQTPQRRVQGRKRR